MRRETWSEFGAVTAAGAGAATIFCCLPFATGIVGASVAAFGSRFAQIQPYLIGASVALLAYSFYKAYRPEPTCVDDRCETPGSRRRQRITVWLVAGIVVMFSTASWWADWVIFWAL